MALSIVKELAVVEDIEFGAGTVTQSRPDAGGDLVPTVYNKVNASHIPMSDGASTVEEEIADTYTQSEIDASLALKTDITYTDAQLALKADQATTYSKSEGDASLALKADKSNVLEKDGNTVYVPTAPYNPATMKFVQDTVTDIGAGDMAKGTYDTNDSGSVDNTEAVGGVNSEFVFLPRGVPATLDGIVEAGIVVKDTVWYKTTIGSEGLNLYLFQEMLDENGVVIQSRKGEKIGVAATVWQDWGKLIYDESTWNTTVTKFADGTMITSGTIGIPHDFNDWTTGTLGTFIDADYRVFASVHYDLSDTGDKAAFDYEVRVQSETVVQYYAEETSSVGGTFYKQMDFLAIGRWK